MLRATAVIVALTAAAIMAAPAGAATVSASGSALTFAGGGERNDLRVKGQQLTPGSLLCNPYVWDVCVEVPTGGKYVTTVTDEAGGLVAGSNCWARDRQAICAHSWKPMIKGDLGAGDDAASLDELAGVSGGLVHGGAGADTLSGVVQYTGGSGNDRLTYVKPRYSQSCGPWQDGGEGADVLDGGGECGRQDGGPGPDVFRGGFVTYEKRSEPVSVTQDGIANDGAPGEGDETGAALLVIGSAAADTMTSGPGADRFVGGPGADQLIGGAGDDELQGYGGDDWVDGGDGDDHVSGNGSTNLTADDDVLIGGSGYDKLYGGYGNDDFRARDGLADKVSCGEGTDKLTADVFDWTPYDDCEQRING